MRTFEIGLGAPDGRCLRRRSRRRAGSTSATSPCAPRRSGSTRSGWPTSCCGGPPEGAPQGCWECVAMTGAIAAATSRIKVGTWILSALHRNPGITAKAVETLDEISGGRFVFGLGSGPRRSPGPRVRAARGPCRAAASRRRSRSSCRCCASGRADFEGTFHAARDLEQRPLGPRPGRIPIMIGAKGPKMLQLAARHADIWSWYAEERSDLVEFGPAA